MTLKFKNHFKFKYSFWSMGKMSHMKLLLLAVNHCTHVKNRVEFYL